MRFGLSDLDELPSLKEFEQMARAALGADEGIAPAEPEDFSPVDESQAGQEPAEQEAPPTEAMDSAAEEPKARAAESGS